MANYLVMAGMKGRFVSEQGNLYDNFQMLGYVEGASPFEAVCAFLTSRVFPSCREMWSICGRNGWRTPIRSRALRGLRAGVCGGAAGAVGGELAQLTPSALALTLASIFVLSACIQI